MASRTQLILVRHGQTDSNASGRFQGQQDVPLNQAGLQQADAVAARLARFRAGHVVSSDLARAVATAEAVASASGLVVSVDARLREIDVGSWQGRTGAEVAAENPWFEAALASGRDFRRSETGETATEAGGGPDRRRYEITPAGRERIAAWMFTPDVPSESLQSNLFAKTVVALLTDEDAGHLLDLQRAQHMQHMRVLTRAKDGADIMHVLLYDHALFHIEADLRWIDLTSARLETMKAQLK